MATTVARLEAILSANTRDFDRAMNRSETKMQKTGRVAGIAGAAIAGGLAFGLEKSVHAALDAQKSQARLDQAFSNAHLSATKYTSAIVAAEARSRKLGFTDEQVKGSLGSLITATGSYTQAEKQMGIAQDLARFKSVDLEQATKALTMAHAGSLRPLKQLGIDIPKVTTAQDALKAAVKDHTTEVYKNELATAKLQDKQATFANVLQTVSDKVGGQADAYSKTAAGSMEQFKAQLAFLEVSLGTALLPALTAVTQEVTKATVFFSKHTTATKAMTIALGVLATALLAARIQQLALNLAVLANPYVAAIAAVVAAGIAIYVFRDKLKNVYDWITTHWVLLSGILAGPIGLAVAEIIKHRDTLVRIFTNLPHEIAATFTAGIGAVKNAIVGLFGKVIDWVKGALGIGSPSKVFHEIGQNSIRGYINGVGSMAGALKHAVVQMAEHAAGSLLHGAAGFIPHGGPPGPGGQGDVSVGNAIISRDVGSGHDHVTRQVAAAVGYAAKHGWRGTVNSAWRSYSEQEALWQRYLHGGPLAARPGTSSHEKGQAVDVSNPTGFAYALSRAPASEMLFNRLGSADPVHFSVSGYDVGGWLPTGLSLAYNGTGRPERVLGPGDGGSVVFNFPNYVGSKEELMSLMRTAARQFSNRNGRSAFGGM